MAQLRAFRARAFAPRALWPVWGAPEQQHSGTVGPWREISPTKIDKKTANDDELVIIMVCQAFTAIMAQIYGDIG